MRQAEGDETQTQTRMRREEERGKFADTPDSVFVLPQMISAPASAQLTVISLGQWSPNWLNATYPPALRVTSTLAYLVLLRVEIARFTQN